MPFIVLVGLIELVALCTGAYLFANVIWQAMLNAAFKVFRANSTASERDGYR